MVTLLGLKFNFNVNTVSWRCTCLNGIKLNFDILQLFVKCKFLIKCYFSNVFFNMDFNIFFVR